MSNFSENKNFDHFSNNSSVFMVLVTIVSLICIQVFMVNGIICTLNAPNFSHSKSYADSE
jgi:hypothetical protein